MRTRDQHVIVLTRASPTDSRLVRKLLHTLTTRRHQNYAKYHQKHSTAEDRTDPSSFFDVVVCWETFYMQTQSDEIIFMPTNIMSNSIVVATL